MIELMLQAERALSMGMVDRAEQLYWQAIETDSRNGIAIVGLAKIAIERGDDVTALRFARKALELDPDNGAAQRIAKRLEDAAIERGLPAHAAAATVAADAALPGPPASVADGPQDPGEAEHEAEPEASVASADAPATESTADAPAMVAPVADVPVDEGTPVAAPTRARPDVEWPAADLEQARRGTLPPVRPAGSSGAGAGSPKGGTTEWPGADSAPKPSSPPDGDRDGGRGKAPDPESGRGSDDR